MNKVVLNIEIEKTDNGYYAFLSDDIGGSGVKINSPSKESFTKNLSTYVEDYLYNLDKEE